MLNLGMQRPGSEGLTYRLRFGGHFKHPLATRWQPPTPSVPFLTILGHLFICTFAVYLTTQLRLKYCTSSLLQTRTKPSQAQRLQFRPGHPTLRSAIFSTLCEPEVSES